MKRIYFVLLTAVLLLLFTACASPAPAPQPAPQPETPAEEAQPTEQPQPATPVSVAVMKGPTGVGAAYLMEQAEEGQNSYSFELADAPEQVVAMLTNGSVDIAALPSNLAANLYAKTGGEIRMAAIITSGMLYLLEEGDTIHSWDDLQGQTVYATGRGANPEFVINYLLAAHNLDTVVEFKSEHAELATLLAAGEVKLGMLPEPFVTSALMQNDKLRIAFDLSQEWDALGAGSMAMTGLVVRNEFAAAHPEAVAEFLTALEQSINYAQSNVTETAALTEKHGIIAKAAVAEKAIGRCNLTFISGEAMQEAIAGYYQVLFDANPQSVGGALPDEEFYYIP